jgi:hypothetical protein
LHSSALIINAQGDRSFAIRVFRTSPKWNLTAARHEIGVLAQAAPESTRRSRRCGDGCSQVENLVAGRRPKLGLGQVIEHLP